MAFFQFATQKKKKKRGLLTLKLIVDILPAPAAADC